MFSYHHTRERERERERSPLYDDSDSIFSSRRLVRTNSKRTREDPYYDDDVYDDYPYASTMSKARPSRALTIRQPSQLEKYNIWARPSSASPKHTPEKYHRAGGFPEGDDDEEDRREGRTVRYKYTATRHAPAVYLHSHSRSDDEDDREREFRLKIRASFGRPKSSHGRSRSHARGSEQRPMMAWTGDVFRTREKWIDEDWETRERERERERERTRRDSAYGLGDEGLEREKSVRFRRVKRTRTEEWKPLSGFRR